MKATAITKEMVAEALQHSPTQEELKEADSQASIIVLTQGMLADGQLFYAYLAVPPSKYRLFKLAEAQGSYKLQNYGEILHFEKKGEPSEAVMEMMEEKYGINHNFEDTLNDMMNETMN